MHWRVMRDMQPRIDKLLAESVWVRRIAYSLLRDTHEAEDVTQEVLATAYQQQPTASGASLRAWLRTVTKRKAARKKQLMRSRAFAEEQAARGEREENSVTGRVALHALLAQAVGDLPPLLGEAVMLRYFDDLAPRQIAKRLNVTSEVARQRVSRGLQLLRQRLDRDADPANPERGRDLWSVALIETLSLPKLAAVSALSPLLLMSLKTKALSLAAICVAGLLFILRSPDTEVGPPVEKEAPALAQTDLSVERDAKSPVSKPAHTEERELVSLPPTALATRVLHVRSMTSQVPRNARAVWVGEDDTPHTLVLDESCDVDLIGVPETERIWIAADDHLTAFIDLEPERSEFEIILDPGLTVQGLFIEDGGIPRARTTLNVRWTAPFMEELEQDRVPEALWYELRLGYQGEEIRPDAQGTFTITAIQPFAELRFSLPSSHLFESKIAGTSEEGMWCHRQAVEGETIRLETLRTLSISARLLRADNGEPARYASGFFHFRNTEGDRRGSVSANCDSHGIFSDGYLPPGWRAMTAEERAGEIKRWNSVTWEFQSYDPSLGELKGSRKLEADEFFIDLGDLYLESRPVLDAVVLGADGTPLAHAALTENGVDILRANMLGRVKIPSTALAKGLKVLALGHAIRQFTPAELIPAENGVIPLQLEAGIELHLSLAKENDQSLEEAENPMGTYLVSVSWQSTPFLRSPRQRSPFDFQLHNAVLELNEGLGGFDQTEGPETCVTQFPDSGVVRLISLRPGAPIQVQLRGEDASVLDSVDLLTPESPGRHELKLRLPDSIPEADPNQFRILGRVIDENSLPVAEASLMYFVGGVTGFLQSDADGRFESGPLPKDGWPTQFPFRIWAEAEGHVQLRREWPEYAADDLTQLEFVMPRSRRIEIHAADAEGKAVAIDGVTLRDHPEIKFEGQATDAGSWVIERAPVLDLSIQVQASGNSHPLTLGVNESTGHLTVPSKDG